MIYILKKELSVARGFEKAQLVLKNINIINVFTEQLECADIAICKGRIAGIGEYFGETEIDCSGKYASPGLMDGHIHLESSMLQPVEFAKAVLPHGTTTVITDPHEIANVCGVNGIEYMMKASEGLPLDVYFTLPSCVPSTPLDESGACLTAKELEEFYQSMRVLGLAEVMDYFGTLRGDEGIFAKINSAKMNHRVVDGHAPGLHGKDVCAYVLSGIQSDHECVSFEEALEKLRMGQWIMIREGTAAKNLEALMGLFQAPYYQRAILVSDDKHPYDLLEYGHMDDMIRKAVSMGADPCIAIKMATYNTATYFGIKGAGAIAPGYQADIVILSDLNNMTIESVLKQGEFIYRDNQMVKISEPNIPENMRDKVLNSFHCNELRPEDFALRMEEAEASAEHFRVIELVKDEIGTNEIILPLSNKTPCISIDEDILKIACIERHHNTGHIGIGFVRGYGLKKGAIASSVSHDSHNIIVIGTNDTDIAAAANCIRKMQGGWAVVSEENVLAELPLKIAGLMSEMNAEKLADKIKRIKALTRELGVTQGIDPFMTMAFISLPVIPKLRLLPTGLYDVEKQKLVPVRCKQK